MTTSTLQVVIDGSGAEQGGRVVTRSLDAISNSAVAATKQVDQIKNVLGNLTIGVTGLYSVAGGLQAISGATQEALRWLGAIETSTLGIAASFMAGGSYIDQMTGKALTGQKALNYAMEDSRQTVERLKVANFQTIATLDQLIRAYQETLPVAQAKGFNRQQVEQFTLAMVQAAGAIDSTGRLLWGLGEETRSLLTGAIRNGQTRIANVLGITNEDIRAMQGDSNALFSFLMGKLQAFQVAGVASQTTWGGLWSNMKDILMNLGGTMLSSVFEGIKTNLIDLTKYLITIDATTKQIKWNPEVVSSLKDTGETLKTILNAFVGTVKFIYEHWEAIKTLAEAYVAYKIATMAGALAQDAFNVSNQAAIALKSTELAQKAEELGIDAALAASDARRMGDKVRILELERASLVSDVQRLEARTALNAANIAEKTAIDTTNLSKAEQLSLERSINASKTSQIAVDNELNAVKARQATLTLEISAANTIASQSSTKAALAAEAHSLAMYNASTAGKIFNATASAGSAILQFFGGWVGLVITAVGLLAMAWLKWGNEAEEANKKALKDSKDVLKNLDDQIAKINERNRLEATPTADVSQGSSGNLKDSAYGLTDAELKAIETWKNKIMEIQDQIDASVYEADESMINKMKEYQKNIDDTILKRMTLKFVEKEGVGVDYKANDPKDKSDTLAAEEKANEAYLHMSKAFDQRVLADMKAGQDEKLASLRSYLSQGLISEETYQQATYDMNKKYISEELNQIQERFDEAAAIRDKAKADYEKNQDSLDPKVSNEAYTIYMKAEQDYQNMLKERNGLNNKLAMNELENSLKVAEQERKRFLEALDFDKTRVDMDRQLLAARGVNPDEVAALTMRKMMAADEAILLDKIVRETNPQKLAQLNEMLDKQRLINSALLEENEIQVQITRKKSESNALNEATRLAMDMGNSELAKQLSTQNTIVAYEAKQAELRKQMRAASASENSGLYNALQLTSQQLDLLYSQKDVSASKLAILQKELGVASAITGQMEQQYKFSTSQKAPKAWDDLQKGIKDNSSMDVMEAGRSGALAALYALPQGKGPNGEYTVDQIARSNFFSGNASMVGLDQWKYDQVLAKYNKQEAEKRAAEEQKALEARIAAEKAAYELLIKNLTAASEAAAAYAKKMTDLAEKAISNAIKALNDVIDRLKTLSQGLRDAQKNLANEWRDNLLRTSGAVSPLTAYQNLKSEIMATYDKARAGNGNPDEYNRLVELSKQYLEASKNYNASGAGFQTDFAWVQDMLALASNNAGVQATQAELLEKALQTQAQILQQIADAFQSGGSVGTLLSQLATATQAVGTATTQFGANVTTPLTTLATNNATVGVNIATVGTNIGTMATNTGLVADATTGISTGISGVGTAVGTVGTNVGTVGTNVGTINTTLNTTFGSSGVVPTALAPISTMNTAVSALDTATKSGGSIYDAVRNSTSTAVAKAADAAKDANTAQSNAVSAANTLNASILAKSSGKGALSSMTVNAPGVGSYQSVIRPSYIDYSGATPRTVPQQTLMEYSPGAATTTYAYYAKGGNYPGGSAIMGEEGPEFVDSSPGYVYRADETKALFAMARKGVADNRNEEEISLLREQVKHLAALVRVNQAGFKGLIEIGEESNDKLEGMEYNTRMQRNAM